MSRVNALSEQLAALLAAASRLERGIDHLDPVDAVEGRRFLLRMLSASVDTFVEHGDVAHPRFVHAAGPHRKMFADCPDTDYLRAPIQVGPGRSYVLRGRIPPGALYVGVMLYGKGGRVAASLTDEQLGCDADGRFDLHIGTDPAQGPWLRCEGDESSVMVRQYFADRAAEPTVELELIPSGNALPPAALDAETLAGQVHRATRMLDAIFARTRAGYDMARTLGANRFAEIPAGDLFPTPDNRYRVCWYSLGPGERLRVRGTLPTARYFGLSLCNAWMESFDYRHHVVNLNHAQLDAEDGRFKVTVGEGAHAPNHLDTAGHRAGYLIARYLLPEGDLPELSVTLESA